MGEDKNNLIDDLKVNSVNDKAVGVVGNDLNNGIKLDGNETVNIFFQDSSKKNKGYQSKDTKNYENLLASKIPVVRLICGNSCKGDVAEVDSFQRTIIVFGIIGIETIILSIAILIHIIMLLNGNDDNLFYKETLLYLSFSSLINIGVLYGFRILNSEFDCKLLSSLKFIYFVLFLFSLLATITLYFQYSLGDILKEQFILFPLLFCIGQVVFFLLIRSNLTRRIS